ncbi:anaphase-promoting complex subunit 2 [Drosophila nasuta]|uniref:Anaphase-promoting complex subunit 2 n=1 Tax=Drosophila albomicans TaxID=7291 RepID=A0A6P8X9X8_DROAB|nr:anaphase-promoting complex subunit 2 [Drosophila albomicans]XP_060659680.1 anaphase-promoting complex subunit 2 [Drosophila nasuta]
MGDFSVVWSELLKIFPILNGEIVYPLQEIEKEVFEDVYRHLNSLGSVETFTAILDLEVESTVRNILAPKLWKQLASDAEPKEKSDQVMTIAEITAKDGLFSKFIDAVNELYDGYRCLLEMKPRLIRLNKNAASSSDVENIKSTLRNALLARLPPTFNSFISDFYSVHYGLFTKDSILSSTTIDSEVFTELPCPGCNYDHDQCCCQQLTEMVNSTNLKLLEMGLIDRLAGSALTILIKLKIKEHINDTCLGIFDRSHLKQLETWINDVVMTWLTSIFTEWRSGDDINNEQIPESVQAFKVKLTYFMYETFAQNVISQFFSIIIDYPDSTPAIEDLKICMEKIDMRVHLTESLRSALEARILHPGVNTMDILTGYVAAIKAIRHLDNTGVILEIVTAPIKDYLRKRNDTVRRVVTGLTEEGPTDLSEELAKGELIKDGKDAGLNEFSNWENWEPDPFGIDPDVLQMNNSKIIRSADIISMVVDIYGSKELFMVEYRNLMADRLLSQLDFNSEKEIRNLELLKIRFGESLLHSCEVMLKDVTDSKRINAHIHGDGNINESTLFDITSLIISAQFWPSFNKESLQLPEELENEFKKFTKAYESYKGNRTLNWRTVTGRVNIVIEIGERVMEMTVPPTQAVIIYHFQHKSVWTLDELSSLIKVPPSALRRRISFWQNHGLITETEPGVFSLLEEESEKIEFEEMNITDADEEDLESAMASASDQREEELQVFWSYIVGMLTNLDSMPIDRIHQMLKLFASNGGGVEFTQDELKHFLQRKVREHKLLFSGGVYQLAK